MPKVLIAVAVLAMSGCSSFERAWSDPSCSVSVPPADAGVGASHAQMFKVYPRRSTLASSFTGCQVVWTYAPRSQIQIQERARVLFLRGVPVAIESEGVRCEYKDGKLAAGSPAACGASPPEAVPSMPAQCEKNTADSACAYDAA